MLGFERTYHPLRPNPYVALRREDLHLHFFGMPGFDPAQSYGTCLVQVPDVSALFEAFAAGMRAVHGKLDPDRPVGRRARSAGCFEIWRTPSSRGTHGVTSTRR